MKVWIHFFLILITLLSSCQSKSKRRALYDNQKRIDIPNSTKKDFKDYYSSKNKRNEDLSIKEKSKREKRSNIRVMTWNIQNLGGSKSLEELVEIAKIINNVDIVAIQEVVAKDPRGAKAVAIIVDELNRMGSKWDYAISDPTKSPSVYISERYAYIWRTSKLRNITRPYLDKELENQCYREPYIGKFLVKKSKEELFLVNIHTRKHNDNPELDIENLIKYSNDIYQNCIILGDFNLSENHEVWNEFYDKGFEAVLHHQKTTLKRKCKNGNYTSHSVDNCYIKSTGFAVNSAGVIDFAKECESLIEKRKISDHFPVVVELVEK